jgi:hypothetical protein
VPAVEQHGEGTHVVVPVEDEEQVVRDSKEASLSIQKSRWCSAMARTTSCCACGAAWRGRVGGCACGRRSSRAWPLGRRRSGYESRA